MKKNAYQSENSENYLEDDEVLDIDAEMVLFE